MKQKQAKRPPLPKREGFIQIRVTDEERETIDRLAYERKLTMSEYLRRAALVELSR